MPLPAPVPRLLEESLVAELVTVDAGGRPHAQPMIPLWDGERIHFTSSVLFSRKLERIRARARVAVSLADEGARTGGATGRATIQGEAVLDEADLHAGWERLLPLWEKKEPAVRALLANRTALPLFWERSVVTVAPRRVLWWADGRTDREPEVFEVGA